MADMIIKPSSGNSLVFQDEGGDAALTVGTTGTTTFAEATTLSGGVAGNTTFTGNTTLSGTANNLGTVTTATIATGVHGKYVLEDFSKMEYTTMTSITTVSDDNVNICGTGGVVGTNVAQMITGSSTSDLLTFEMNHGGMYHTNSTNTYMGAGLSSATNAAFSSGEGVLWRSGQHTWGSSTAVNHYDGFTSINMTDTVTGWGLSASTTYYFRLIGQTHSPAGTFKWGVSSTNPVNSVGVKLSIFKWRLL